MSEINGHLGMDKAKMIALLGKTMYDADLAAATIKELFQNAYDAVKKSSIKKITVTEDCDCITVSDTGCGMTPETVQNAFFTIGGSNKEGLSFEERSGGLGMAKMLFLFGCEWLKLTTVKDGILTTVYTNPSEIQNDSFVIRTETTALPNGTTVEVQLPHSIQKEDGSCRIVDAYLHVSDFFNNPIVLNGIEVTHNGNLIKGVEGYKFAGTAKAPFADFDIYIKESVYGRMKVLSSGLFQFYTSFTGWRDKDRMDAIVDVKPHVGTENPQYPFNNQREGFRSTVMPEINDLKAVLKRINYNIDFAINKAAFSSAFSIDAEKISAPTVKINMQEILDKAIEDSCIRVSPEECLTMAREFIKKKEESNRISSLDTSGVIVGQMTGLICDGLELDKPLFHNNTNFRLSSRQSEFCKELGSLLLMVRDALSQLPLEILERECANRMKSQYWGISLDKNYMGVNVSPKMLNFMAVNPFAITIPGFLGMQEKCTYYCAQLEHVLQHEFNHNYVSGEGANFTSKLASTYAKFTLLGEVYTDFQERLRSLVTKYLEVIETGCSAFSLSRNVGESLHE